MEEERKEFEKHLKKQEQDLELVFQEKAKILEGRIKENENQVSCHSWHKLLNH